MSPWRGRVETDEQYLASYSKDWRVKQSKLLYLDQKYGSWSGLRWWDFMAMLWTRCFHFRLSFLLELAGRCSLLSGSGRSRWMLLLASSVPSSASSRGPCCPAPAASASFTSASRPPPSSASTGWPQARTAPWSGSSDSPAPCSNSSRIIKAEVSSSLAGCLQKLKDRWWLISWLKYTDSLLKYAGIIECYNHCMTKLTFNNQRITTFNETEVWAGCDALWRTASFFQMLQFFRHFWLW